VRVTPLKLGKERVPILEGSPQMRHGKMAPLATSRDWDWDSCGLSVRTQYAIPARFTGRVRWLRLCLRCLSIRQRFWRFVRPRVFMSHIASDDTGASAPLQDDLCRPQRNMGPRVRVCGEGVVYYVRERTNCRTNALFPEIMNSALCSAYANANRMCTSTNAVANLEGHKCNQLMSRHPGGPWMSNCQLAAHLRRFQFLESLKSQRDGNSHKSDRDCHLT